MSPRPEKLRLPYTPLCVALGLVFGWIPLWLHGPIPQKFDVPYLQGSIAIWGWYLARVSIGFWIGVASWRALSGCADRSSESSRCYP